MRIGIVYPQTEYGNDPVAIRDYAQTAEALGFSHILAYDHVLGANPDRPKTWKGPYTFKDPFHEPFVLFSHMAAVTAQIEFTTGIIILPQRETALVAKQAATLDVLSGGRFRLGVGIGWNWVEYEALNQDFHTRGKRIEEQVDLLRQFWTQPLVTFEGDWHTIRDAGLNPLPVQRPIPIWFGGHADAVLRRVAQMGDGWMPNYRNAAEAQPHLDKLREYLLSTHREPEDVGLEPRIRYGQGNPEIWREEMDAWQTAGATHLTVNMMYPGFKTPDEHLLAMRRFAKAMS